MGFICGSQSRLAVWLRAGRRLEFCHWRFYIMVEEEFPAIGFALFGVLLAELHGFFAVVVLFGYILYFHLLELRGFIAAKEYFVAAVFYQVHYMVR